MVRPAYCDLLQNPRFVYIQFKKMTLKIYSRCVFLNLFMSKYHAPHSFFIHTPYYTCHYYIKVVPKIGFIRVTGYFGNFCHLTKFFTFLQFMNVKCFLKSNFLLLMWSTILTRLLFFEIELTEKRMLFIT